MPRGPGAAIRRLLAHGYAMAFSAPGAGRLVVRWTLSGGKAGGPATVIVVAKGARAFGAAAGGTVKLTLTSAGRRLLKHAKRMTLSARATFTPTEGKAVTASRKITLKR